MNRKRSITLSMLTLFSWALILLVTCSVTHGQGWFDTDWPYRKPIIIDADQVADDLTNFPVLVDISDTDLASDAQPDGDDIFFTAADGTTTLDHEIETYADGDLVAWVEVPLLDATTDTTLYMYYGNPGADNQENVAGTWNGTSYVMVHHLEEITGDHIDSTGLHNDSDLVVVTDQTATGRINGADEFNGSTDYVRVPDNPDGSLQFDEGSLTVEAWINPLSVTDSGGARIANNRGTGVGGSYAGWQFKIKDDGGSWRFSDTGVDDAALPYEPYEGTNTYSYNALYHVVMVYVADTELRFYVDGALDGTLSLTSPYGSITNALPTVIGASIVHEGTPGADDKQFFDGIIDEVRLSKEVKSAAWIETSYTNQNNPSTFYLLGDEEIVADADDDGVADDFDNCPSYPNGPNRGTCTEDDGTNRIVRTGQVCTEDTDCAPGEFCEKIQADTYPPGGNGIGDACDCEADFDCDPGGLDVDAINVEQFLWDFGRSIFNNPCTDVRTCFGDFNCDGNVDADDVPKLLEDFGRTIYVNPCPAPPVCVTGGWCVYP